MSKPLSRTKKAAVGASVVLASLGLGGAGAALVAGGSASAATSGSTPAGSQPAKGQNLRRYIRRHTVEATITVKTKNGYETLDLARGTVESISPTSITVNSPDGSSLTATINAQTKFHNTTEQQLQTGDKVGVLAAQGVAKVINAPKSASSSTTAPPATS